ncbi:MAG: AAA family ATPase [Methanocellales archaeon]
MLIALSGPPGSGKSTVGMEISKRLKFAFISAGDLFRKMASEKGLSLAEFSKLAESDHEIDKLVDSKQLELALSHENAVIEGRLAAYKIPADLKILLLASIETRAARIAKREQKPFMQVLKETKERERSEQKRYKQIYGIDLNDLSAYDLIINTERFDQAKVVEIVLASIRSLER